MFNKVSNLLVKGGLFILEPQNKKSYTKRKCRLSSTHLSNLENMKIMPNSFPKYLITNYPFEFVQVIFPDKLIPKGFNRQIYIFKKI